MPDTATEDTYGMMNYGNAVWMYFKGTPSVQQAEGTWITPIFRTKGERDAAAKYCRELEQEKQDDQSAERRVGGESADA